MDEIPLSAQFAVLAVLFVLSGFFAMAETAMMASNRHRLRHAAQEGHRGAQLAVALLAKVDRVISVILLCNTLINAAAALITGHIALTMFGGEKWALEAGTIFVTFCLLVFSEITPKVVGATYPDWLTPRISYFLAPLLRIAYPVIWFVNLFVVALLKLLHLQAQAGHEAPRLTAGELRSLVLESGQFVPSQHRAILLNLFDLEHITVDDVMAPRGEIEAVDIEAPIEEIRAQLGTSFHTRVPVFEGEPGNIVGILHQRRLLSSALAGELDHDALRRELAEPYFIPTGTGIYAQLQFFRDNRQRMGLVVDEYGELLGLVTLEDIVEEIVGKFTTGMPGSSAESSWDAQGAAIVDGSHSLREVNRALGLALPLDGPKTLNGLITEHLQDIPEVGVGLRIAGVAMEIVQTEDRRVKTVKLYRPAAAERTPGTS
ncbi:MAG: HlyC/CorC family transporter [Rhodocyclaceae bacterium]|nr:HlyC/CorC family transporter [Rhodocyclaceae bacterium]